MGLVKRMRHEDAFAFFSCLFYFWVGVLKREHDVKVKQIVIDGIKDIEQLFFKNSFVHFFYSLDKGCFIIS